MASLKQNGSINSKSSVSVSQYAVSHINDISIERKIDDESEDTVEDIEEYEEDDEYQDDDDDLNGNNETKKLKKILNDVIYHEKNIKRNLKRLQKEYSINHAAMTKADEIKKLLIEFDNDKLDKFSKYEEQRKSINGLLDKFQILLLQTDLEQIQLKEENKKLKKENKILTDKLEMSVQNEMILAEEYQKNIIDFDAQIQKYKDQINKLEKKNKNND